MANTTVSVDTQRIASVVRQIVAVAAVVMGALTSALSAIHLPVAISSVMTAAGAVLLAVEHYVADPSTGNAPSTTAPAAPAPAPAPQPAPVQGA